MLDSITDHAIYQLDTGGHVRSWNRVAERLKGYSAEEIIGRHFSCFYTQDDIDLGTPDRALETARIEGKFLGEGWRVRADGTRIWARVVINPILDAQGQLRGFVKITRDVTRRHEMEEQLRAANDAMAHMEKLQSLGRVAGGIAHDFNNLLTAILSSIDSMKGSSDQASVARGIASIEAAAEQASQLTSQLLAFARNQPLAPKIFALGDCVEELLPTLRGIAGSTIKLVAHVPEKDVMVEIDPTQLRAALINLVTNARDAIMGSGQIEITLSLKTVLPTIRRHKPVVGQYVKIAICDDGQGISPDIVDKVFEPFFTTKPIYFGTGLGLSQVYGFARQSAGNVAVGPRPGGGTEVAIYLPVHPYEGTFDEVLVDRARHPQPHVTHILFVEDNKLVGSSAVNALVDLGYDVVWLEDGEAALKTLAATPDAFDIIVSDIIMPGLSGVDLARQVKKKYPQVPVLLTSGYSDQIQHLASIGCDFIKKPYRLVELAQCMDAVLQSSRDIA